MASVDLETKEIRGATKGTLRYFHEEGHLEFGKSDGGDLVRNIQTISIRILIIVTAMAVVYSHILIHAFLIGLILASIFSEMFEEVWCWIFAFRKRRLSNVKRGGDRQSKYI